MKPSFRISGLQYSRASSSNGVAFSACISAIGLQDPRSVSTPANHASLVLLMLTFESNRSALQNPWNQDRERITDPPSHHHGARVTSFTRLNQPQVF
ncbi:hypothetical protein KC335_g128 [Hortaea werneckii]|nr:hypothetical protein KC335_g128 [Hortaea werneckii]